MNKRIVGRVKKFILGNVTNPQQKSLSNNKILYEILKCFKETLEFESVGKKILYPTTFKILLNTKDFDDRLIALPFVVKEVVNEFYLIIKEYQNRNKDCRPPSRSWDFQFSPCDELILNEGIIIIEPGAPFIIGMLYNNSINNSSTTTNTRASIKPLNSEVYAKSDISIEALNGVRVIATGIFSLNIDNDFKPITDNPENQGKNILAEITFNEGILIKHYEMIDKVIFISGSKDTRKDTMVMIINSEHVINGHATIKYDNLSGKFLIAAFGPLKVNEKSIEISPLGNLKWYPLTKRSKLLIGNYVPVEFLAKK